MTIETPGVTPTTTGGSARANKIAKTANGIADKADDKIAKLAERAENAARRAETVLHDGIEKLRTSSRAYADTAVERWDSTQKAVEDRVREKPIQGLAIAAGVGLVIGLLLGSRRH